MVPGRAREWYNIANKKTMLALLELCFSGFCMENCQRGEARGGI